MLAFWENTALIASVTVPFFTTLQKNSYNGFFLPYILEQSYTFIFDYEILCSFYSSKKVIFIYITNTIF